MRLAPVSPESGCQWSAVRRRVAVRSITAASGNDGDLPADLRSRWKLLSAGHRAEFGCACRCRYRERRRSIAREDSIVFMECSHPISEEEIRHAASLLRAGKLVAFP